MNFCENCNVATEELHCPLCGTKKLRPVNDDDFCLLTELEAKNSSGIIEIFDEEQIPYSAMPYGSGVESRFGMPLKYYRLFVPYKFLHDAQSIIREIDSAETEEWRKLLLENTDNLNVAPKLEKKIRKKFKLSEDTDFFEYCIDIIKTAEKISDKGKENSVGGGQYLLCSTENKMLAVNSKSFEILSITVNGKTVLKI